MTSLNGWLFGDGRVVIAKIRHLCLSGTKVDTPLVLPQQLLVRKIQKDLPTAKVAQGIHEGE